MRRALIVVGKAPRPGSAKTRLVPPLSSEQAARLYRGFLLDAVHLALQVGWEQTTVVHPPGDGELLKALLPRRRTLGLLEQERPGLGHALAYAFQYHFAAGYDVVTLIGSDNPTLSPEPIDAASAALQDGHDLAIGPSADGGYYLIGMCQPHLEVFDRIEWSTSRVYAQTLDRAGRLGLQVRPVSEWYDVDEPADLDHLQRDLALSLPQVAPNTRAVLDGLSLSRQAAPALSACGQSAQRTREQSARPQVGPGRGRRT